MRKFSGARINDEHSITQVKLHVEKASNLTSIHLNLMLQKTDYVYTVYGG